MFLQTVLSFSSCAVPSAGGPLRDAEEELGAVRGQRPVRGLLRGLGLGDRQAHRHQVQDFHRARWEVRSPGSGDEDMERHGRGAGVRGEYGGSNVSVFTFCYLCTQMRCYTQSGASENAALNIKSNVDSG